MKLLRNRTKKVKGNDFINGLNHRTSIICHAAANEPPEEEGETSPEANDKTTEELIQSLRQEIELQKSTYFVETENNQALVPKKEGYRLITLLSTVKKMSKEQALLALSIICQKGGTSKNAKGDIYARIDNIKITLADIREIKKNYGLKFTLRQWARTFATDIYLVCSLFGIHGDLAKILGRKDSSLSDDDLIWCSNFQMYNPDCPEHIRAKIKEHFDDLFKKK